MLYSETDLFASAVFARDLERIAGRGGACREKCEELLRGLHVTERKLLLREAQVQNYQADSHSAIRIRICLLSSLPMAKISRNFYGSRLFLAGLANRSKSPAGPVTSPLTFLVKLQNSFFCFFTFRVSIE